MHCHRVTDQLISSGEGLYSCSFLGMTLCQLRSRPHMFELHRETWRALLLTLIFVPSSSGSGSGIISICEHIKQTTESKHEARGHSLLCESNCEDTIKDFTRLPEAAFGITKT